MTQKEIAQAYHSICRLLENRQVKEAFDGLKFLANTLQSWQLQEDVNRLQETYRMMLQYAIDGIADPEQRKIYLSLVAGCFRVAEELQEGLLAVESPNYVYSQKRYFEHVRAQLPKDLADELELAHANAGLPELLEQNFNATGKRKEYAQQHEALSSQMFKQFWLAAHFSDEERNLFNTLITGEHVAMQDKCLAISALTLSLMRSFDAERLMLLAEQCTHADEAISQRALVGLLPVLAKYNLQLPFFPALRNRLVMLFDNVDVATHTKHVILQYIRTNETEHISRKMQEEILPEMLKAAPKIKQKIEEKANSEGENYLEAIIGGDDPDEKNPEWEDVFENADLVEKLQEMSELQMEGSDVYMGTFYRLKGFPFFQEISNWFRPFDAKHSEVCELFEGDGNRFLTAMTGNSFMCSSDLYSFSLSLRAMPEDQRDMMSKAFAAEAEQLTEMEQEEKMLAKTRSAELISNAYMQDLYRFFNLFPHRGDFASPFAFSLSLHKAWFFSLIELEEADFQQIAEYYFAKNLFPQALEMFERITEITADLCQKKGYCHQQTGNFNEALRYYRQAEIMAPDSKWTIRKIAYCYRSVGDYANALTYYQKAAELLPDNLNLQIQIGNCHLNLKQYDDALAYYFKVDYLTTNNLKMWRAIGWTSFLSGKQEQAAKFYEKILALKPEWTDFLNAGHIAWAQGDEKRAIALYKQSLDANEKAVAPFVKSFASDIPLLMEKDIDPEHMAIVLDFLRYYAEN